MFGAAYDAFDMAQEPVVIQSERGETASGEAVDIARYSTAARAIIGTMWIVGGLLGGAMFIIVPVVHLITTWALPVGGILMGMRAYKRRVIIYQVSGTCPVCHEHIEFVGGSIDDPAWQVCGMCKAVLKVRPAAG